MSQTRYIPKLNDRDVIRAFESVAKKHSDKSPRVRFGDGFGVLEDEDVAAARKLGGYSLHNATLTIRSESWQWTRLQANPNDPHSADYDRLTFSWNTQQPPDRLLILSVSSDVDSALSRPLSSVNPEISAAYGSHSETLRAMESAVAQVLVDATEHRHALDHDYLEKLNSAEERLAGERARELSRIKEERERNDTELASRVQALDERQRELDDLKKSLDDRNNTHVRRDIRSSLLALAKERLANFGVSKETRAQYIAVHAASVTGLIALALGATLYASQIAVDPETKTYPATAIALAVKSAALAAAAIALGSWYLGWLNRWLQRIADAEFRLQQFRLDIERASWLAETVLEWKSTSSDPFPELLAARLSTGLFSSSASELEDPKTPATHLAEALFGAASSAKLKLGEQELSFDRRSIKGLEKAE